MHATYTQTGAEMLGSSGAGPPTAPLLRWDCLGAVRARTSSRRKCAHACPRMVGMIGHQPLRQTRSHRSSRTHARRQDKAVHACGSGQALSFSTRDASAAANLLSGVPSAPKLPALRTASTSACFVALWPRRLARSNASSPCASVGLVASLGHALGTAQAKAQAARRLASGTRSSDAAPASHRPRLRVLRCVQATDGREGDATGHTCNNGEGRERGRYPRREHRRLHARGLPHRPAALYRQPSARPAVGPTRNATHGRHAAAAAARQLPGRETPHASAVSTLLEPSSA